MYLHAAFADRFQMLIDGVPDQSQVDVHHQIFLVPKVDLSRFHFFFFWLQIAPAIFPTLVLSDRLHDFLMQQQL